MNGNIMIREWGHVWHVKGDGGSTTTATFSDALLWATGNLEPGGPPVSIRWGLPIPDGETP